MDSDFVSLIPQFLGKIVIVVLMVDEESGRYGAVVRVNIFAGEQPIVEVDVVVVDRVFKCDQHHLRNFIRRKFSRYVSS